MVTLSLSGNKLNFSGEVDLHEVLKLEELETKIEGLNYRIDKHPGDVPGAPAIEIVITASWAELSR
jgi:hypothetical protein